MPERFHYSKPKHRLGELTALPDIEGEILSEVKCWIHFINHLHILLHRRPPIRAILTKVIMAGIIRFHRCKLFLWLVVLHSVKVCKLVHSIMWISTILFAKSLNLIQIQMQLLVLYAIWRRSSCQLRLQLQLYLLLPLHHLPQVLHRQQVVQRQWLCRQQHEQLLPLMERMFLYSIKFFFALSVLSRFFSLFDDFLQTMIFWIKNSKLNTSKTLLM